MRLLEQKEANWSSIAPFLDTICLPLYRYQIEEKELQLEEAGVIKYIAEELEKRLIGRILLLPACSFLGNDGTILRQMVASMDKELVHSGFHYTFLVILEDTWDTIEIDSSFHILKVQKDRDRDLELQRLYEEILIIWESV